MVDVWDFVLRDPLDVMKKAGTKTMSAGLVLFVLSSCNGLTGINDLPPGLGLGGSDDGERQSGGRDQTSSGGSPAAGGRQANADGGARASSGGAGAVGGRSSSGGSGEAASGGVSESGGGGAGGMSPSGGSSSGGAGGDQSTGGQGTGGLDGPGSLGGSGGQTVGQLPLLDDFSIPLDTVRWKELFDFEAKAGVLECTECTKALLWNQTFSLPLEASVRLMSFGSTARETNLVLLASSPECDLIEVLYVAEHGHLGIASCQLGSWQTHTGKGLFLGAETFLGGRVRRAAEPGSVVVEALVNGNVELTATFTFINASGSIGLNGVCVEPDCVGPVRFDDFRGGELAE